MTAEDWCGQIMKHPEDPLPCLGYADWLEERQEGTELAFAMRWMAKCGCRPGFRERYRSLAHGGRITTRVPDAVSWCWLAPDCASVDKSIVPRTCELPLTLFVAVSNSVFRGHVYYPCWRDAVEALADGLTSIRRMMEV